MTQLNLDNIGGFVLPPSNLIGAMTDKRGHQVHTRSYTEEGIDAFENFYNIHEFHDVT